ncbi:EamA/RhaT family transporter [Streptomyces sp. MS06]|uniref:EamA/RhaT family transporter n=1 Tax=Streptomyces sp. MS06 TaxID=3385974 RepID=UPI0039A2D803
MSSEDDNAPQDAGAGSPPGADRAGTAESGGPLPEPLRFFGTTWVDRDDGYRARRVGAAAGALAAAVASCLVLRFAYQGLRIAEPGSFVTVLVVVVFAVCSALAFRHTWDGFGRRPDPGHRADLRGLLAVGFVGSLLAYFFRSLTEAPGEGLHRREYEEALARHRKRSARRTGNPSRKRRRP